MDDTKYGKYFIKEPYMDGPFVQGLRFYSKPHFGEKHFSMMWHCIPEPILLEGTPHHHFWREHRIIMTSINSCGFMVVTRWMYGIFEQKRSST